MTFQQLLQGAEVLSQNGNPAIAGVEYDSRRVRPGTVFVAMKGETSDGNRFIDQAIAAGAVAIVTDSATEAPRPAVAWAQVVHGRRALARLSGPGNGWRCRISSGIPRSRPILRTSSLNRSFSGSISLSFMMSGSPPTLWWLLMVCDGPGTNPGSGGG